MGLSLFFLRFSSAPGKVNGLRPPCISKAFVQYHEGSYRIESRVSPSRTDGTGGIEAVGRAIDEKKKKRKTKTQRASCKKLRKKMVI